MLTDPAEIEKRSFEIITSEMGHHDFSNDELSVVKRVIHTTADFDYARILRFANDPITRGRAVLNQGCRIYSDTRMILAGVSKLYLKKFGCEAYTLIDDPDVHCEAQSLGITRSIAGMRRACRDRQTRIFLIGNAPTALHTLVDAVRGGICRPELVIGVPVGFVEALESKERLSGLTVPHILTAGRKGGSTVAAAIFNALLYGMGKNE